MALPVQSPNLVVDWHWVTKVTDFGLSRLYASTANHLSSHAATNPRWLAPEVMATQAHSAAADVFRCARFHLLLGSFTQLHTEQGGVDQGASLHLLFW